MTYKSTISILIIMILLTGCGGVKNIQDLTYIVAIGMDYDDATKEYIVYLQGLNFANVAKQEGGKPVESIPSFVASSRGKTLNLAVSELYKKSEPPIYFGHVRTLILSQRLINSKSQEVLEEVARNRSLRHTLRLVTTEEEIEDIFNIKALFNYPAIYTVLFKGKVKGQGQQELKPTSLMIFLRNYYEPMGIAKIPSVSIDKDTWKADQDYPVLFFDGYTVFEQQEFVRNVPFDEAVVLDWLIEKEISMDHAVEEEEELVAAVNLSSPDMKVIYDEISSEPTCSLEISASAELLENIGEISIDKLKKIIEDDIKKKVENVYYTGVENRLDLLNVGEKWFRERPQKYKELKNSKSFYLKRESLKEVNVNVQIFHFNSYEYERK
ncbi:Ger(x)C family spore germination protein [Sutcliffiella horikoshii]|uniref:Ger(x)C family spore germination protein n=1 Tax=Sutcliffiella horikoshii TaxID=79883 RepID=UPI00384C44E8